MILLQYWRALLLSLLLLIGSFPIHAFLQRQQRYGGSCRLGLAMATTPQEIFSSEGWPAVQKELDTLPVFCLANPQGEPLQYRVQQVNNPQETSLPFFYCTAAAAEEELQRAQQEGNLLNNDELGIIPFPLGKAFFMAAQNQAALIPSAAQLEKAGAPAGTDPVGQVVPLFGCLDVSQMDEQGQPVLPLFLIHEEAVRALEEAVKVDGGNVEDFEIVSLSLPRAVELFVNSSNDVSFQFLPPKASIAYIENYLKME